jgi:hypothetical protein
MRAMAHADPNETGTRYANQQRLFSLLRRDYEAECFNNSNGLTEVCDALACTRQHAQFSFVVRVWKMLKTRFGSPIAF